MRDYERARGRESVKNTFSFVCGVKQNKFLKIGGDQGPKQKNKKSPKTPLRNKYSFIKSPKITNVHIKNSTLDASLCCTCLHGVYLA